ncbi:putative peptidase [Aminobacter sp. MSH1]|uniref:M24 family metallopeptidase n=1 Tax=Aminobacter sp. MSH1 TaxID=374606 RepID=UPI000D504910|nr:Xaa-Pro peptidase family protein [Aminobacter sp. MSH1]AWC21265.1 putative peptidase [Aminobacter sp. MSH1]
MSDIGVDWEERVDWQRIRAARVQSAIKAMKEEGIGALIVQRIENLRFLTCMRPFTSLIYYPRYAAVLFDTGHICLLTEGGDYELVKRSMPWIDDLRVWPYDSDETIANVSGLFSDRSFSTGRLGYDDVTSPAVLFGLSKKYPGLEMVDANKTLGRARLIKDSEEIKVIRGAAQLAEIGMLAARETIKEGVRESTIAAEMARAMLEAGADALITHPQVTTDALRRMATDKRLRYGEVALIDINIGYNGYVGDFARTFAVGQPSSAQRKVFQVQLECLQTAVSLVKPGIDPQIIQDAVRDIVVKAGLEKHWHGYITGHGVGVGIGPIEQPLIGSTMGPERELREGMIIAFEPGIFDPAVGPIRNEEMVLVTAEGHETLTRFGFCEKLSER